MMDDSSGDDRFLTFVKAVTASRTEEGQTSNLTSSSEFLEELNEDGVVFEINGKIVFDDVDNFKDLKGGRPRLLSWNTDVDYVLEGPCADSLDWGGDWKVDWQTHPFGRNTSEATIQELREIQKKKVLMFPCCCSVYPAWYKRKIRDLFPQVEWSFPRLRDFCGSSSNHPGWLAQSLVKKDILRIE